MQWPCVRARGTQCGAQCGCNVGKESKALAIIDLSLYSSKIKFNQLCSHFSLVFFSSGGLSPCRLLVGGI